MTLELRFTFNGEACAGKEGDSVLAALMNAGVLTFRKDDHPHVPICGMGICFECLVQISGRGQVRACMVPLEAGMEVTV